MQQDLPQKPGIYVFRNSFGDVIYVGKAKNLRRRVSSYLRPSALSRAEPKLRSLIKSISSHEFYVVKSEAEALLLESQLIKKYSPRYNIEMRDDKRFYMLKLDVNSPFPRLRLARLKKDDGALYYGPFPHASAVKQMLNFLTKHFQLRSCSPTIPTQKDHDHCKETLIRNCSAPCIGKISQEAYKQKIEQLQLVLSGKTDEISAELNQKMMNFAAKMQFEKASEIRDIIGNLKSLFVSSQRKFVNARIEKGGGKEAALQLQQMLHLPIYPRRIECFDNSNLFGNQAVASMVCFIDGKPASSEYRRFKVKTVEGIDDFASMNEIVGRRYRRVLSDKLERPDLIIIDGGLGQLNAAINVLEELGLEPVIFDRYEKVKHVAENEIMIMGLAKRQEELYIPGLTDRPVQLPKSCDALHMLQFIRDEAHRFAITFHREYRNKAISNSILDDIPGIGDKRKKLLLKHFGSVNKLKKATLDELSNIPGIGKKFAKLLKDHL